MNFSERSTKKELLDLGPTHYTQDEYNDCLHQLKRVGKLLGGNRATLRAINKVESPKAILDVGCGGGHFTLQLAKRFPQAHITGIDIEPQAIEYAEKSLKESRLDNVNFLVPNSTSLNYPPNSFDIVTATLVCHHMSDLEFIEFLKQAYKVASKAIIINDLHRHIAPYALFALISKPLFNNRLISHDGLISIERSFTKDDWNRLIKAARIPLKDCTITWHMPFRWIVSIDTTPKTHL